jgi:zinc transporter 7
MPLLRPRNALLLCCLAIACVYAEKAPSSVASMSIPEIEEKLQVGSSLAISCYLPPFTPSPGKNNSILTPHAFSQECSLVQSLNTHKLATSPQTSTLTSRIFAVLFPGSPAVNALLATLYISGPPNFLLALCPPNVDPSSLSVMVAFAVGGLLGDTLFHLLPEIFLGEDSPETVRFVMVEPNRNLLLGVAIMVGFVTFVAVDKGLRIATGGEGHGHDHGAGSVEVVKPMGSSSAVEGPNGKNAKSRKKGTNGHTEPVVMKEKEINASVKLAGYLNLMWVVSLG